MFEATPFRRAPPEGGARPPDASPVAWARSPSILLKGGKEGGPATPLLPAGSTASPSFLSIPQAEDESPLTKGMLYRGRRSTRPSDASLVAWARSPSVLELKPLRQRGGSGTPLLPGGLHRHPPRGPRLANASTAMMVTPPNNAMDSSSSAIQSM